MSAVRARNGKPHTLADCLTCGENCPSNSDTPAVQQGWARRHAASHPGHVVHATTEKVRVYRAQEAPDDPR